MGGGVRRRHHHRIIRAETIKEIIAHAGLHSARDANLLEIRRKAFHSSLNGGKICIIVEVESVPIVGIGIIAHHVAVLGPVGHFHLVDVDHILLNGQLIGVGVSCLDGGHTVKIHRRSQSYTPLIGLNLDETALAIRRARHHNGCGGICLGEVHRRTAIRGDGYGAARVLHRQCGGVGGVVARSGRGIGEVVISIVGRSRCVAIRHRDIVAARIDLHVEYAAVIFISAVGRGAVAPLLDDDVHLSQAVTEAEGDGISVVTHRAALHGAGKGEVVGSGEQGACALVGGHGELHCRPFGRAGIEFLLGDRRLLPTQEGVAHRLQVAFAVTHGVGNIARP